MKFEVVSSGSENFESWTNAIAAAKPRFSFDYNALAEAINALPVGDLINFPLEAKKVKAVVDQLKKRGLHRDTDYAIGVVDVAPEGEPSREVAGLRRLTDTAAAILDVQRGRPRGS